MEVMSLLVNTETVREAIATFGFPIIRFVLLGLAGVLVPRILENSQTQKIEAGQELSKLEVFIMNAVSFAACSIIGTLLALPVAYGILWVQTGCSIKEFITDRNMILGLFASFTLVFGTVKIMKSTYNKLMGR